MFVPFSDFVVLGMMKAAGRGRGGLGATKQQLVWVVVGDAADVAAADAGPSSCPPFGCGIFGSGSNRGGLLLWVFVVQGVLPMQAHVWFVKTQG